MHQLHSLTLLSSSIFILLFSSLLMTIQVQARMKLPQGVHFPAILAFGDSIIDPGNNNYVPTIIKCDFSPYGRDFMGGTPSGRFCNGKIPTDLIAEELGIKELLPAYLDPSLSSADLLTGVSFASGGSGYDPLTSQIVNVIGLHEQLHLFKEYIGKLQAIVGEDTTASILSNSFYPVLAGSDDIANTYFNTPSRRYKYDVHAYTDLMVQGATGFVQGLYNLGARKIAVFSLPPIGCVPSQRTLQGGLERKCSQNENEAAMLFNSKLSSALDGLDAKLGNAKINYIDIYNPLFDIIKNPHSYGFKVVEKGCCGTGMLEVSVLCNKLTPVTCHDVSNYVFWDSYHPTQRAYETLVIPILEKYMRKFF